MAVAIAFGSQGSADSIASVATVAGLAFNAAAGDRIIAAAVTVQIDATITGVLIDGITAVQRRAATDTGSAPDMLSEIWTAAVPTGVSGTVIVTLSTGDNAVGVSTFSITGADATPTDTDAATGSATNISITALTIPTDGAGIACIANNINGVGITWTGAAEASDANVATSSAHRHSTAIITAVGTNTVTADGSTANQALVGVAFGPASGGGAIAGAAAQTLAAIAQSAAAKLALHASASQTLAAVTPSAASKLKIKAQA